MTQRLETAFKRAARLPEAVQDAIADQVLARVAAEEAQRQDTEASFVSAYEVSKHLAGIAKGGPPDLSTNPKYLEGFGESSLQERE